MRGPVLELDIGPTCDATKLHTVPAGCYIQAFTFVHNYTTETKSAVDNRNNKLRYMYLTNGFEGLVLPETSQIHRSTYYFFHFAWFTLPAK
jgi:hypothetical protein